LSSAAYIAPSAPSDHTGDALYRKIIWRIMPILVIGYIIAYIDRVNVSFAKLQMLGDLKFSESVYGAGAGIFFLGYFAFEVPSNLMLHKVGARLWICRVIVTWGIVSALTALVRTPTQFYMARLLLGVAEAGFFPGMILYLTYWFPAHRRAAMVALLLAGNPVSGILGGPLSGFILQHFTRAHGLAGWQWLFILEAVPAILFGVIIFLFLDNSVQDARWLSASERATVAADIHAEATTKSHVSMLSAFTSPKVWLLCAIFFGIEMGSYAVGFWQPTIIRQTGVTDAFKIGLLTAIPYTVALISLVLTGRHSDRTRERRWHIIVPSLVSAVGFLLCTLAGSNTALAMLGLVLAAAGVITAIAMFWALPTSLLGGNAAAAGIAFVNCMGNLGGFFSPTVIGALKTRTGTLNSGLYLMAGCMIASAILILTLPRSWAITPQPHQEPQ
jgi:D-galactonate transporter